ncbi:MAG: GNAT family protein [Rhodobacter sp.]|nr:GNAT family protein [Rhodobacter sp.]
MPHETMTLHGRRVLLRRPRDEDAAGRRALGKDPDIIRLFGGAATGSTELTAAQARDWVAAQKAEPYAWIIELDMRLIGSVRLHSLNAQDRRASLAIGILDASLLGQGLGTEAMRLVARYAFGALDLHRLSVRVLATNGRALAAYRKLGFVEEGRERQAAHVSGVWQDDVIMGLLAHEFRDVVAA